MKRSNEKTATDGGHPSDEELFGMMDGDIGSQPISRNDRIRRVLDAYVFAPGRVAWHDWRARIGTTIILVFLLVGTVGVKLVDKPMANDAPNYLPPMSHFDPNEGPTVIPGLHVSAADFADPLGTGKFGEPIGKQLVHATPAMIKMIFAGAIVSIALATIIGVTAGYKGGKVDAVLMFVTDIVLTIPGLPLIIVIAAVYPPKNPYLVGILLAIDNWPGLARALRSQVLTIREESYVEASRTMGLSSGTILGKDIVPQLMPYVMINSASAARRVVFESVALYFLGILPFTTFNWGVVMNLAYKEGHALVNLNHFYWLFWPMLVIIILSFGLIMFTQGMDRVFNPRIRARHAKTVGGDSDDPQHD
ncbi:MULTISPECIES: ABC transporter permease [unclassified Haladaptatus]|uniref:ABC transporter permease n=1 Tax=unclassified Haladaptatus TaxID=2622732 RepID=UPI00209C2807|nr:MULTISPECIES: ABC transporter permease [unclassified Haladaptatus]MCO8243558.1 ABC transporter permease [Haladaptatus sp. AB643]MCO8254967.1 ABC transporter permease [Haladaptatus sp. AB618]